MLFIRNAKIVLVVGLVMPLLGVLGYLFYLGDLGFYAPRKGEVVDGKELKGDEGQERSVVRLKITQAMLAGDTHTDLKKLTSFFALEEATLSCSVEETEQLFLEENKAILERYMLKERKVDDEVVLCLE